MSDTIWATIIGGAIGIIASSIVTIITHVFDYNKWKKNLRIEKLQKRKDKLEKIFQESQERLLDNMITGVYDVQLVAKIINIFPRKVLETFSLFSKSEGMEKKRVQEYYIEICETMEKSLSEIDDEIQEIVNEPILKFPTKIFNHSRNK